MINTHIVGNTAANTGGGIITTIPQSTVKCNSKVLAVDGSKGTGHGVGIHAVNAWDTANGSSTVNAGGIPVNKEGDADTMMVYKDDQGRDRVIYITNKQ